MVSAALLAELGGYNMPESGKRPRGSANVF